MQLSNSKKVNTIQNSTQLPKSIYERQKGLIFNADYRFFKNEWAKIHCANEGVFPAATARGQCNRANDRLWLIIKTDMVVVGSWGSFLQAVLQPKLTCLSSLLFQWFISCHHESFWLDSCLAMGSPKISSSSHASPTHGQVLCKTSEESSAVSGSPSSIFFFWWWPSNYCVFVQALIKLKV